MTNEIIIRNNSLVELTRIQNVINPIISEQINAHYTLSFDTVIDDKMAYLTADNIVEVDNEYYRIARVVKTRNTSVGMTINCEHITYDLLDNYQYPMPFTEFEGNPQNMIATLLSGTPFLIGRVDFIGNYYIKPNSDNIRGTLIEIANLVGGELVYDKYTISLVTKRGVVSNQEFKLGENLIGVTEEIDYTEGYPRKALEVDVVDLSEVPDYEYLLTIGLGDTVTTIDPILNINETLRIVSKDYNPFQKINPRVQIGNVIRDFTDYIKEEEATPTDLGLEEFKIGDVDCLSLSGVDITQNYQKYLQDGTPFQVTAIAEYPSLNGLTGLFVKRSNDYFGIRVKEISNGVTTDYYYRDLEELKKRKYPSTEDTVILIIISYKDIDSLTVDDEFKVFAVKFGKGTGDNLYLSEFRVGDVDCLSIASNETEQVKSYLLGKLPNVVANATYESTEVLRGIYIRLKEEYPNLHLTMIDSYINHYEGEMDEIDTYVTPWPEEDPQNWEVGRNYDRDESFTIVISDVPFKELQATPSLLDTALINAYGVTFKRVLKPIEMKQVMYGMIDGRQSIRETYCFKIRFVTNITNFRENFTNNSFIFEYSPPSEEYYPAAIDLNNHLNYGVLVQLVDGVIVSRLSLPPPS